MVPCYVMRWMLDVGCDEISCLGGQDGRLQIQIGMLVLTGLYCTFEMRHIQCHHLLCSMLGVRSVVDNNILWND